MDSRLNGRRRDDETGDRRLSLGGRSGFMAARAFAVAVVVALALVAGACRGRRAASAAKPSHVQPFNFEVVLGPNHYQIEGRLVRSPEPGRLPAVLVLNGGEGNARRCVAANGDLAAILGIQVACISIPGYGRSSGPARLVGPQAVAAARRALDLLAQRADIDPNRLAVWGIADGATAAGLLMDCDRRPRSLILQSGTYDMVKLWPEARLGTKLHMLRQVWPSRRLLRERSVVENLPRKLKCSVLILHGARDRRTPVGQAVELASELKARGVHVSTDYFPRGRHYLGAEVRDPAEEFLRGTLLESGSPPAS